LTSRLPLAHHLRWQLGHPRKGGRPAPRLVDAIIIDIHSAYRSKATDCEEP